jgi:hypothetical protein
MRVGLWRLSTCGVILIAAVAGAPAQPPEPRPPGPAPGPLPVPTPVEKGTVDTTAERARLQADLLALLKRLSAAPAPGSYAPVPGPGSGPKSKYEPGAGGKGSDSVREGMNLFRDNDFEAARRVFQLIEPSTLPREDRAFVRYMLASCWRRIGKPAEAEVIYREVANSGDDEFLASCAVQMLSLIRSEQELQAQLEQLRSRAKSR